jgi:hypothetical protein
MTSNYHSICQYDTEQQLVDALLNHNASTSTAINESTTFGQYQHKIDQQVEDSAANNVDLPKYVGIIDESISLEDLIKKRESVQTSLPSDDCKDFEWTVHPYDSNITEAQSMKEELKRLQIIRKYMILDADREEELDRLSRLAGRIFNVPTATINIVDIGRFFIMASHGVPLDIRETARKDSICSHTVWMKRATSIDKNKDSTCAVVATNEDDSTTPLLIIPDASIDHRFHDNPYVWYVF